MTQTSPVLPKSISKEAVRGTAWNYLSFASGKLLNFISTLILARLLVPDQFGLVAYCTIAIQYIDIFNTAGIDSALIARKDKIEEAANSAFVSNIILGGVSFLGAWFAAPGIASFFNEPAIIPLLRLLAITLPISGLGLVPYTMLRRGLRFQTKLIPDVASSLSKGSISIILALLGFGPWSLIWGQIAGQVIGTVLAWLLAGWVPTRKFEREATRDVLTFGGHIILVEIAGQLRNNVDYLIVGRVLGATVLGVYTLAYRIPELAIRSFDRVVGGVSFPLLAQVQSNKDILKSAYLGYLRYISLFTFSIGAGIAIISDLFVHTFLSSDWNDTVTPMALIAIALAIMSVGHVPGIFYKAISRPDILNRLSLLKLPIIIGIVWFATRWGIVGVSIGQIVFAIFAVLMDSYIVSRIINFPVIETVRALFPAFTCTISMVFVTLLVKFLFSPSGFLGLFFVVLVGVLSFVVTLRLVEPELVKLVSKTVKKKVFQAKTI